MIKKLINVLNVMSCVQNNSIKCSCGYNNQPWGLINPPGARRCDDGDGCFAGP